MKKLIPYVVLILMMVSVLVPVGIGYARGTIQPVLAIAESRPLVAVSGAWSIAPCKYIYQNWEGEARVSTTISNLSDEDMLIDLGDGTQSIVTAQGNIKKEYTLDLQGQIERIYITKLATQSSGLIVQECLVLKIQPKGGDTR